jgi:hypothetical protein
MRWAGHVALMSEKRNIYIYIFGGKPGKKQAARMT